MRLLLDTAIKKSECMALTPGHIHHDNPAEPYLVIRHLKPSNVYKERNIALIRMARRPDEHSSSTSQRKPV